MSLVLLLQSSLPAFTLVCVLFGLLLGSFLNVVIHRLPIMLEREWQAEYQPPAADAPAPERYDLVVPRSRCPHCGHAITALENVPILSYLALRGRCSACHARISPRYMTVEALTGLLSGIVAWHFGFGLEALGALCFTWALVALSSIDVEKQLLPDRITLPLLWLGLLFNLLGAFTDLRAAVIGAMGGYLSLWGIYHVFKRLTGKEGMGYGDFKLYAALGAWLGWQHLPLVILLAALMGIVVGIALMASKRLQQGTPIPFGPFLAASGWITLMWGTPLSRLYLDLTGVH